MSQKRSSIPLAALVAIASMWAGIAHAEQPVANQCYQKLTKAQAKFASCFMQFLPSHNGDGVSYRDSFARCVNRYDAAWDKMQNLTGSNCVGPRWVDNLDGTVTDKLTGLVWEQKGNADGVENYANPHDADNRYTVSDDSDGDLTDDDGTVYTDFLAALNAGAGFAGSTGWRVPSRMELASIVTPITSDMGLVGSVDPVFGPLPSSPVSVFYCTSSSWPGDPAVGVLGMFTQFLGEANGTKDILVNARAVRGGHW